MSNPIEYTVKVYANGNKYWYLNGQLHREDGPAIEHADGSKSWWLKDQHHREDGPAIESPSGNKWWFLNDQRHREDGPAVELVDGTREWFLNDEELTEAEHTARMSPTKELTVAEIEKLLGYSVKVVE